MVTKAPIASLTAECIDIKIFFKNDPKILKGLSLGLSLKFFEYLSFEFEFFEYGFGYKF